MVYGDLGAFQRAEAAAAGDAAAGRRNRATVALYAAQKAGIDQGLAIDAVAISMSECNAYWISARPGEINYPVGCWPTRICVGIEPYGKNQSAPNGLWYPSVFSDPDTSKLITMMGGTIETPDPQAHPITGQFVPANAEISAALLEWGIVNRKANLLKSFSLGPTQMWMAQTPMSYDYVSNLPKPPYEGTGPAGRVASYPQTWDDLFAFYTATSVERIFDFLGYLRSANAPGLDAGNEQKAIEFLRTHQTGNSPGVAEQYYANFFGPNLRWAANKWAELAVSTSPPF